MQLRPDSLLGDDLYLLLIEGCKDLDIKLSAQQVQKIIPEAVVEVEGILMLDMNVLSKYMREAKKELKAKNS